MGLSSSFAFLSLISISANLFLLKQIHLFGLSVCASDAFAVGYLFTLNLIQEFFGQKSARKALITSSVVSLAFLLFSWIHMTYVAIPDDILEGHFSAILSPMPRLVASSLASFILVQLVDISFFAYLRKKCSARFFPLRVLTSLLFAEILDTLLYSFFALWGQVNAFNEVLLFSILVKGLGAILVFPLATLAKRYIKQEPVST